MGACAGATASAGVGPGAQSWSCLPINKISTFLFAAVCVRSCVQPSVTRPMRFLASLFHRGSDLTAWNASQCILNGCFNPVASVCFRNK